MMDGSISKDVIKDLLGLQTLSPFVKLNIILKIQRRERPFTEQLYFNFKNVWDIYSQLVINNAYFQLSQNEWFSFIDELGIKQDVTPFDDLFANFDKTNILEGDLSVSNASFVGNMMRQMNEKAQQMKRESTILQRQLSMILDEGTKEQTQTSFSLVLCSEWEKAGDQKFFDLNQLIKSGVPSMIRHVVWGDLMKTSLIELDEKKNLIKTNHQHYK